MQSVEAVSGVATLEGSFAGSGVQFTVLPISASGTGTVTVKPDGTTDAVTGYEAAYATDGATALTVDLSAQQTFVLHGRLAGVKVTSDNSSDTFHLVGNASG
jgi:hypothetical protein